VGRFGLATVRGESMSPTLLDGDRLLVRYDAVPAAGDIVLVRLPADADGEPRPLAVKRAAHVEPGGWWVERDNPVVGLDSWAVGVVAHRDVVAVVVGRVWPPGPRRGRRTVRD